MSYNPDKIESFDEKMGDDSKKGKPKDSPIEPTSAEATADKETTAGKSERKAIAFEDAVTPEHLEMISRASGGFSFREDPSLPPNRTGYTNLQTRTIHYNPLLLKGSPEHGIKPWRKVDIQGFAYHEAGHHAPEVVALQDELLGGLKNIEIPEDYKGSPDAEQRFLGAVHSHLHNALADVWLESFMGRRPYYPVREAISSFQKGKGEIEDFKGISRPDQLLQVLLRSRYFAQKNLKDKVSPEVFEAFRKIEESGAMRTLMDKNVFENYFASQADGERTIEKKMAAYNQVFLPEYLSLMEKELEERKKQKQQQKSGEKQKEGDGNEKGEDGKGGGGGGAPSEAVPLTKEEEQELIEQIIKEIEEAGKEMESRAPSEEEKKKVKSTMGQLKQILVKRAAEAKGEKPKGGEPQGEPSKGEEAIKELGREFEKKERERMRRGLAEAMQVKQETIRKWERIKEKYPREIESLAGSLVEVFLDDRRKRLEYLKKEGEIVPGLEYETISALLSGQLDPETKMTTVTNPEFLETEIEWIVDTSGSMSGQKIEKSVELLAIVSEGFKKVKETLEAENLVAESEEPFRMGVTKFTTLPERVTKLSEPINDKKEVIIIDKVSEVGGGTEETGAISQVYKELKLSKKNVIKIIVVLTDGEGNREGVAPIIQQVEDDKEVIFLVVGLGDTKESSQAIVDTYVAPLRQRESNVFGFAVEKPEEALPAVLEFLKREVNKRKT